MSIVVRDFDVRIDLKHEMDMVKELKVLGKIFTSIFYGDIEADDSFIDIMDQSGWLFQKTKDEFYLHSFDCDSFCGDDILWLILAKYVKTGCYIDFIQDDFDNYRWKFIDGKLYISHLILKEGYTVKERLHITQISKINNEGYNWDEDAMLIIKGKS